MSDLILNIKFIICGYCSVTGDSSRGENSLFERVSGDLSNKHARMVVCAFIPLKAGRQVTLLARGKYTVQVS